MLAVFDVIYVFSINVPAASEHGAPGARAPPNESVSLGWPPNWAPNTYVLETLSIIFATHPCAGPTLTLPKVKKSNAATELCIYLFYMHL